MNEGSGILVLWILVPLFLAVGLYLIWYTRRRKKMLEAFSKIHYFPIRPERKEELQRTLDSCFSLHTKNLIRSFAQLASIIDAESIWLFRTVELLDINPYAQSYATHFPRIAALFSISTDHNAFFILDKSMRVTPRLPDSKMPNPDLVDIIKRITASCNARHSLSVTLNRGHGLIYFEPIITGGETITDIESLYCIGKELLKELRQ